MSQGPRKVTQSHQFQINRITEIVTHLESIQRYHQRRYFFLSYLTTICSYLGGVTGATFLAQAASESYWHPKLNCLLSIVPVIQWFIKVFRLEDSKNDSLKRIRITGDYIIRLRGCLAKMNDFIDDGQLDQSELETWERIITFMAQVDALAMKIDLGQTIQSTVHLDGAKMQLQKSGITGLPDSL